MSKFLVAKKRLELSEETGSSKLLVSKRVTEISDNGTSNFSVLKKYSEITTTVTFDSCGGSSVDNISFVAGKTYGELPSPSKSQHIFLGWFTQQTGGTKITSDSVVSNDITKLYAQWELVNIDSSNCTSYEVITTSSYKNTGIYTASIKSSSTPIYIDWGDGSVEKLTSSISQKSHTYSSAGTFTVKISNNITSFAPSYNNNTWYGTTSQNRYTFNKMISTGSNIASIPSYAFYYCQKMTNIDFMETCFINVTSLPSYCFYYCTGLTSIQGAKRFTSLGSYCFQYCTGLSGTQDLSEFSFTSLTNSYVFSNCSNVVEWIFPEGFTGTTLGTYTFSNNTKLTKVGQLSSIIIEEPDPEPEDPSTPDTYDAEVEYLESTGTQWIDTGHVPTINTKVDISFQKLSQENVAQYIFGSLYNGGTNNVGVFSIFSKNSTITAAVKTGQIQNIPIATEKYVLTLDNSLETITLDDTVYNKTATYSYDKYQNTTITLFGYHRIITASNVEDMYGLSQNLRIYSYKVYENGVLVQDLIPVIKNNVGYMYDLVSKKLLSNIGAGEFLYGPIVSHYDAEVEYLESTGTQWIDTTHKPTETTEIFVRGAFTADTTSNQYVFGSAYNGGDEGKCYLRITKPSVGTYYEGYCKTGGATLTQYKYFNITTFGVSNLKNEFYIDDTVTSVDNLQSYDYFEKAIPIYLLALNRYIVSSGNDSTTAMAYFRLYSSKIYENGVLIQDLIPVRKDGKGYMYDRVSKKLFSNGGTGEFIIGPDKEQTQPALLASTLQIQQPLQYSNNLFKATSISTTIVPLNTLTSIPSYCFQSCTGLKNIIIPKNVKTINERAFYSCTSLTSIDYQTTALTSIGNYAFYQCYANNSLSIPDTVKSIGSYAFHYNYSANATDLNLPSQLTSLGTYAYQYCYNLKNLTIPSTLTSIGDYAFAGCYRLSSIIDNRLTSQTVGVNTFGNTTGTSNTAFTGYQTRGNNKLSVYVAATGYDESYWNDPLQNPDKGGFQLDYLDPENIKYCNITFNAGNGQFISRKNNIQFIKLIIDEIGSGVVFQISRFELIKNDGTQFNWTNSTQITCDQTAFSSAETPDKMLDHSVDTKCYGNGISTPIQFTIDIGESNAFNINDIVSWQWWTANDTASYSERNPKSFKLQFSTDGINYVTVDEVTNYSAPAQNKVLGYEGTIKNKTEFPDVENEITNTLTYDIMQGKKIGTLPTPTCPAETPYFGGWYTGQDGTGEKYKADSLAPNQDTLTLYAYYGTTPFASYTVDLNGQWVKSTSQSNPDNGQYDGVYESNSNKGVGNGYAKMYIRISGYTQFTIYIRSYAESSYDYVVAMNLDVDVTSNPSSSTSGVKAHTSGKQSSDQSINGYTKVEYNNIDGGEHFICVAYRKDGSVDEGNDQGYVLIEQPADPITITFDIGNGELVSGSLTATGYQNRPMRNIAPKVQGNSGSPYFVEWNTMPDGSGSAYSSDTMLPISSTLTLYAIYSDQFPYTFIEYLDSSDGGYINTEHTPTLNTSMDFEMMPLEETGSCYIGTNGVNDSRDFRFFQAPGYNHIFFDFSNSRIGPADILMNLSQWYTISCWNNGVKVNDKQATSSTVTISPDKAPIYALGSPGNNVDMRLKYLKIYENDVLVQDLVPVRKGNVGYMYDMVSGKIFENAGTGSFILGPDKATEPIEDLLCFEAAEANSTISMQAVGDAPAVSLKTTTDGILWRDFIVGQTTICLADVGDKVYFKAKEDNAGFGNNDNIYNNFVMTGKISASGNIQSILYKDEILNEIKIGSCFLSLFKNCKSLITPPELPALKLQASCYQSMFTGCKSLIQAPELPATELAYGCYGYMFAYCNSLTEVSELPAIELVDGCYEAMFYGCRQLSSIPKLHVNELVLKCYKEMFLGCTKLSSIEVDFTDWKSDLSATTDWLKNVSPTGTFTCPAILPETYGTSYIPEGWNIEKKITTASEYVQDGLIAMWDGIENAGWNTHDENATEWKDLVGNNNLTIGSDSSKAYFKNNAMHRSDTLQNLTTSEFINYPCTIQLLVDMQYTDASRNERFFSHTPNSSNIRREFDCYSSNSSSAPRAYPNVRYGYFNREANGFWDITIIYPDSTNFIFTEHICNKSYSNVLLELPQPLKLNVGAWQNEHSACNGDYYNIRIYNRVLTEEEIQHNYNIDRLRFGSST